MHRRISVLFLIFLIWTACQREETVRHHAGPDPAEVKSDVPDREGWDAMIRISTGGKLQAVIRYGHMVYYERKKTNFFDQGVQIDMFDKKGSHTTKLTADRGEYNESTQDIRVLDHVVVVSDTGLTLYTPVLKWDQALEKIISDTSVMITSVERDTVYGTSFESNADLTHYIIKNPKGSREEGVNLEVLGQKSESSGPEGN
ncbi:LPS export ABC transporter periplasmic protein LptC [bacterium]|nr:LPS export ABC transporter periplasmic protein LptC [bacterium]